MDYRSLIVLDGQFHLVQRQYGQKPEADTRTKYNCVVYIIITVENKIIEDCYTNDDRVKERQSRSPQSKTESGIELKTIDE